MKQRISLLSCWLIIVVYAITRLCYTDRHADLPVKVTTWDALGYYLYLPASFIYHDVDKLGFIPSMDKTYQLSGGDFYQATRLPNGNYAGKYFVGIALLQAPFFLVAHAVAPALGYTADGFSAPYQMAIAWGAMLYVFLALLLLRRILLRYFTDSVVAFTLLLTLLATNAIQYIAIEGGQSHAYIFPLYVFMIYATIRWHEAFRHGWLILIGLILGVAVICRPTEAVMLFIPLLWDWHDVDQRKRKWAYLRSHKLPWLLIVVSGLIGVAPQLLYWKFVTGQWVYDVGSKWDFLNPHFRVLLGWEKGWFMYTPVTVLMVLGLLKMQKKTFAASVIWFSVLNLYIIIAWHIWRYGGSYSCRALVQSYPVWAFALASLLTSLHTRWMKLFALLLGTYFLVVNLFQIYQYNETIIHYDHMNREYYCAIYLNPHPSPLDYSLLDSAAIPTKISRYSNIKSRMFTSEKNIVQDTPIFEDSTIIPPSPEWILFQVEMTVEQGLWDSYLVGQVQQQGQWHEQKIRLSQPQTKEGTRRAYAFYLHLEPTQSIQQTLLKVQGNPSLKATIHQVKIITYGQ